MEANRAIGPARERRLALLRRVQAEHDRHGRPPTIKQLTAELHFSSTSVTWHHVTMLLAGGLLERIEPAWHSTRNLRLTASGRRAIGRVEPGEHGIVGLWDAPLGEWAITAYEWASATGRRYIVTEY